MKPSRIYLAVALVAVVVHLGALWNQFALDDRLIVLFNPMVQSLSGVWGAFGAPYWPANLGGLVYRPLERDAKQPLEHLDDAGRGHLLACDLDRLRVVTVD